MLATPQNTIKDFNLHAELFSNNFDLGSQRGEGTDFNIFMGKFQISDLVTNKLSV